MCRKFFTAKESFMKCLSVLALAGVVLFAGCSKDPEWVAAEDPLPLIGTKARFTEKFPVVLISAIHATDVLSGRTPEPYLCQATLGTLITSVHNDEKMNRVHVMLEEDSKVSEGYGHLINPRKPFCKKGAITKMTGTEFSSAVRYLAAKNIEDEQQRKIEKEIEQVLKQRQ